MPRIDTTPHIVQPTAVYTVQQATAALGLKAGSLPREIREGRLRVSRRCGRHYITGAWLLDWLAGGEVTRYRHAAVERNGHAQGVMP